MERFLGNLRFSNRALKAFPLESSELASEAAMVARITPHTIYAKAKIQPVQNPKLICVSESALNLLGIASEHARERHAIDMDAPKAAAYLSASERFPNADAYYAHCYCGHQFGSYSGQLGDGAAMYAGELQISSGKNTVYYELQFKGAGLTPYSRLGDGRKVLRSSIREFLACEYMSKLEIPTTRSMSIAVCDDRVERDQFYSGDAKHEQVSIITRLAPTFLRFGSFEIFKARDKFTGQIGPSFGNQSLKETLMGHAYKTYFQSSGLEESLMSAGKWDVPDQHRDYAQMYAEIVYKTATLVGQWQSVGFCHGVLNSDNMSILGLTIDYGPYGFMEYYDENFVPNSSDHGGRYKFSSQPEICEWNCKLLAEAFDPVLPSSISLRILGDIFMHQYNLQYHSEILSKLGLGDATSAAIRDFSISIQEVIGTSKKELIHRFLQTLRLAFSDYTNVFVCLERSLKSEDFDIEVLASSLAQLSMPYEEIIQIHTSELPAGTLAFLVQMLSKDPESLYRIGVTPEVVERELAKTKFLQRFSTSYQDAQAYHQAVMEKWKAWLVLYRACIEATLTSNLELTRHHLYERASAKNPKFTLRNAALQNIIVSAERGEYSPLNEITNVSIHQKIFQDNQELIATKKYMHVPIEKPWSLKVSCSS